MPCVRLYKKDLIKVGRVRFKIRDIMSPVYREIENGVDVKHESHREQFPSMMNESISSSIIHQSQDQIEGANEDPNALLDAPDDVGEIAEAHQNALLTESDQEDEPDLQHANTVLQGDIGRSLGNDLIDGMNAVEDLNSGRGEDDGNNTQFEPGKLIA